MQWKFAHLAVIASTMLFGAAYAGVAPEDTGISLAGGYSQVKVTVPSLGGSATPSGTDFAARATFARQGAFAKAEYERIDASTRVFGVRLNGRVEETRVGLGYAFPIAKDMKIYPAADYVLNRPKVSGPGGSAHECEHGYFVGGGFSLGNAESSLYGRAGYYHVSANGGSTTGPDALLGIGADLSPEAAVFLETRYTPLSASDADFEALAIRAGVKLKF